MHLFFRVFSPEIASTVLPPEAKLWRQFSALGAYELQGLFSFGPLSLRTNNNIQSAVKFLYVQTLYRHVDIKVSLHLFKYLWLQLSDFRASGTCFTY